MRDSDEHSYHELSKTANLCDHCATFLRERVEAHISTMGFGYAKGD